MPVLVLLIITILYSRKLSYSAYGQFQKMWLVINILNVVISFGLPSLILSTPMNQLIAFYNKNKGKVLAIIISSSAILLAGFYFISTEFNGITKLLLTLFILIQTANIIVDSLFIKYNQLIYYIVSNFIYAVLFFGIHLYFYYTHFILQQLVIGMVFISVFKFLFIFCLKPRTNFNQKLIDSSKFYKQWAYISLNEIISVLGKWLDKIFLLFFISTPEFAIYYNGSIEIPFLGMMIGSAGSIMLAQISQNLVNRKLSIEIFKESFKLLSLISFPLFFFFLISHDEVFYFLFENKYDSSIPVFLVYILLIPVRINHYGVILQCYGQSKHILYGTIIDIIIALFLMWILYPLTGMLGVAAAIVISTYIQITYYLIISAKTLNTSVKSLLPINYLIQISIALLLTYILLFLLKKIIPPDPFLFISVIITTSIILISVIKQLRLFNSK